MTLDELGIKHGTDKSSLGGHGYLNFYEDTLPKNPKKLLEIGCLRGDSIRMWKEYFPNTEIHCLDLFEEYPVPDIEGVKFWKGNQVDWRILEQLEKEDFDVIIEDAAHISRLQMMTFFGLFNGKHYYIEDISCCDELFYRESLPKSFTAKYLFENKDPLDDGMFVDFNSDHSIVLIQSCPRQCL